MITAVEPHPEDMQTLKKNVDRIACNVVFIQTAVSDEDGFADFSFYGISGTWGEQFLVHQKTCNGPNIGKQVKLQKSKQPK